MEFIKNTSFVAGAALFSLSFVLSGCVAKQAIVTDEIEKPAELVESIEKITMAAPEAAQATGFDAFELSGVADDAYNREDWGMAEKYYRRLIRQVPQDAYGYFRLGNVLMQFAKLDAAINAYNQALTREPNHIRALKNRSLAYLLRAEINLENTVAILKKQNDSASESYLIALGNLQRLNGMPLHETVSPVQGLYLETPDSRESLNSQGSRATTGTPNSQVQIREIKP